MPVRKDIPYNEGLFFITFTCYKWLPLIEQTNGDDIVYGWFDYLKKQNHRIAGYVIIPNHVHALIDFARSIKKINTVIGDGKRFMAYEIIKRLKEAGKTDVLMALKKGVVAKGTEKGKLHEVWEESFDFFPPGVSSHTRSAHVYPGFCAQSMGHWALCNLKPNSIFFS